MSSHRKYIILIFFFIPSILFAETHEEEQQDHYVMNNDRLNEIIRRLDNKTEGKKGLWQFKISNLTVTVITDEKADRMRIIIPVVKTNDLEHDILYRIMQANFDSTLDGRYAIAKDMLWSTYVHPLSSLDDEEFLLGLGQTVNLVSTFGSTYSSGLLTFGGGDSKSIQEKQLLQELLDKGI